MKGSVSINVAVLCEWGKEQKNFYGEHKNFFY